MDKRIKMLCYFFFYCLKASCACAPLIHRPEEIKQVLLQRQVRQQPGWVPLPLQSGGLWRGVLVLLPTATPGFHGKGSEIEVGGRQGGDSREKN